MSKAQECRYEVDITAVPTHNATELRVDISLETSPLAQASAFIRDASTWEEVLELVKKHTGHRIPFTFGAWYKAACWDLLPPRHEFARFSAIDTLIIEHYPHLEHIDVTALPFLRWFDWCSICNETRSIQKRKYTLSSVRITGLTKCKYLEELHLRGMLHHPFLLKLKAPFRNLQALQGLNVGFKCVNQRYPLELVASQSLRNFTYNGRRMLEYFKAFRSITKCVCAAIHCQSPVVKANALAKAIAYGPLHDPSLVVDIASVITRTKDEQDCLHVTIDALMTPTT